MNERNTSVTLLAAGAAAGLTLTYLARRRRARLRRPITQALTILVPRDRAERFIESQERMLQAVQHKKIFAQIERVELRDAPDNRGTELHLAVRGLGKYAIKDIVRRAKSLLETGEVATGGRYQ